SVGGDALDKAAQLRLQPGSRQRLDNRLQPVLGKLVAHPVPDDAGQAALPERYVHEAAGLRRRCAFRDEVVERLREWERQQNPSPPSSRLLLADADRRWLAGTGVIVRHRLNSLPE